MEQLRKTRFAYGENDTVTGTIKKMAKDGLSRGAMSSAAMGEAYLGAAEAHTQFQEMPRENRKQRRRKLSHKLPRPSASGATTKNGYCGKYVELQARRKDDKIQLRALHATKGWRRIRNIPPGWAVDQPSLGEA